MCRIVKRVIENMFMFKTKSLFDMIMRRHLYNDVDQKSMSLFLFVYRKCSKLWKKILTTDFKPLEVKVLTENCSVNKAVLINKSSFTRKIFFVDIMYLHDFFMLLYNFNS